MHGRKLGFLWAIVSLVLAFPLGSSAAPLLIGPANEGIAPAGRVQVAGHVPVGVQNGRLVRIGAADPAAAIDVSITMPLRDEAALDAEVAAMYDPRSPSFGHYLAPNEFSRRFGAADSERRAVEGFLQVNGLQVTQEVNNGALIHATGSVAQVQTAFGVELGTYRAPDGRRFRAPTGEPSVPVGLAGIVGHVSGLDDLPAVYSHGRITAQATAYSPGQIAAAYDAAPLEVSGFNGAGETIASVQFDSFNSADVSAYEATFGLPNVPVEVVPVDGGATLGNGSDETTADIELQLGAAAGVSRILVYSAPNHGSSEADIYQRIASDDRATTVSTSWGSCELYSGGPGAFLPIHNALAQMAAQGQSFFAASGDDGSYDCYQMGGNFQLTPSVDYPASDPYTTGVGGTTLVTAGNGYGSEVVWNESDGVCQARCSASGGGLSAYYGRPGWQTGTGTTNAFSNGNREVPDVALDADPNTGYRVCFQGNCGEISFGGTSAAAPTWAGFAAVYNQYAVAHGAPRLGYANPAIYRLASAGCAAPPLHDVTSGNNIGYPATPGYDLATGWGSIDLTGFALDLERLTGPAATPTPRPTPTWPAQATPRAVYLPYLSTSQGTPAC